MINEAAILAVKSGRSAVSQKDLLEAVEVVLVGKEKKDRILSAQERRIVSYHEVGHALVSALQKDAEPVQKITIVPRNNGGTWLCNAGTWRRNISIQRRNWKQCLWDILADAQQRNWYLILSQPGQPMMIEQATKVARAMITVRYVRQVRTYGSGYKENQYLSGKNSVKLAMTLHRG